MAREYFTRVKCGHPGCNEFSLFSDRTRNEQAVTLQRYHPDKWRCVRHSQPDELLTPGNMRRETDLTNFQEDHGRFWGETRALNGFANGPGFKAFAKDFPAGTILRVTAEIILPTEPHHG